MDTGTSGTKSRALSYRLAHAASWRVKALRRRVEGRLPHFLPVLHELRTTTGRGALGLGVDLLTAWRKHGIDPSNFAAMLLWDIPIERWKDFVVGKELNPFLNETLDPEDRHLSRDKAAIAEHDRKLGLPWLPTLAVVNRREGHAPSGAAVVDRADQLGATLRDLGRDRDLVLKPCCGRQGAGFFLVTREGRVCDGDGGEIGIDDLTQQVFAYKHHFGDYGYLVQPALAPHQDIVELTGVAALATVRVVTALRDGAVALIEAFLKIPAPGKLTDNFRYGLFGTLLSGVDPAAGRLTQLVGLLRTGNRYVLERCATHPATGRRIEGREIPAWGQCLDVARRAALAHPRTATLGWDLALGPSGWVVLDFNPIWGPTGGEACTKEGIRPLLARIYPESWAGSLREP